MTEKHLNYEALFAVQDARRTVKLALVRVLTFDQLLARYANILNDDSPSEVIFAICERVLDATMVEALARAIRHHMDVAKSSDSKARSKIDRYVALLIPHLPADVGLPLLSEYLEDQRKTRRAVGFRALKGCEITPQLADYLKGRFLATGDTAFLKFAMRGSGSLSVSEARKMISAFKEEGDEYWATRVIQSQLGNREVALELAWSHPKEFIWASGRAGDSALISAIREVFDAANDKVPLLGITVWAYGKLGALSDLERMDDLLTEMEQKLSC